MDVSHLSQTNVIEMSYLRGENALMRWSRESNVCVSEVWYEWRTIGDN